MDGLAEIFVYQIDNSDVTIESKEIGDIVLQGFNTAEDRLVFQDVDTGTLTAASFAEQVAINTGVDTVIEFEVGVFAPEGVVLTLSGVADFAAVDYIVA